MLPAGFRMRRSEDFRTAVRRGARAGRDHLVVSVATGRPGATEAPAPHPRVGFIVSRAVGGAVTRNRVRRRLRHLAAGRLGALPPGSLTVVRALPPAAGASSVQLAADLDDALDRAVGKALGRLGPRPSVSA